MVGVAILTSNSWLLPRSLANVGKVVTHLSNVGPTHIQLPPLVVLTQLVGVILSVSLSVLLPLIDHDHTEVF